MLTALQFVDLALANVNNVANTQPYTNLFVLLFYGNSPEIRLFLSLRPFGGDKVENER